jgi:hypothetical protein
MGAGAAAPLDRRTGRTLPPQSCRSPQARHPLRHRHAGSLEELPDQPTSERPGCDNRRMFCPDSVDWGNLAAWVAGLLTAATLAFGVYQWWKFRSDAAEDERIAQARRVYTWLDSNHNRLVVGNSSSEPVYAVVVHYV